jgi:hypothetical protein
MALLVLNFFFRVSGESSIGWGTNALELERRLALGLRVEFEKEEALLRGGLGLGLVLVLLIPVANSVTLCAR